MPDISALIVDNEPLARRAVHTLLAAYPDITVMGECRNGREAVAAIHALSPRLLFLDVQMPEVDGFGVLDAIGSQCPPAVVLITAYDEFAVQAFEAEALDFLVKPFSDNRFHRTVERVRRRLVHAEAIDLAGRLAAVTDRLRSPAHAEPRWRSHLLVRLGLRSSSIPLTSVSWIEADDYYARLHVEHHTHLYRRSLTQLEGELDPSQFLRVHRSALVNLAFVRELVRTRGGALRLILRDGTRLTVSERRRGAVLRTFAGRNDALVRVIAAR